MGFRKKFKISEESGIPAKMVLVQVLSAVLWLKLGSFEEIDRYHKGILHREDIKAHIVEVYGLDVADLVLDSIFSVADLNGDGTITPLEMMIVRFVAMDITSHDMDGLKAMKDIALQVLGKEPSHEEVKKMVEEIRNTVGIADDGKISREELMRVLREFKVGKDILK